MSIPEFTSQNFAQRLYEQLEPYAELDLTGHLWIFCDAFGSMFQPVEDLASDRPDGLSGWANLLDINAMNINDPELMNKLRYLGQFVGTDIPDDITDPAIAIEWVRNTHQWARGRPATSLAAMQPYLKPGAPIRVRERNGSAWKYLISTRTADTLNEARIREVLQAQKPGPDILLYELQDLADYAWLRDQSMSYGALAASGTLTTYEVLADKTI